MVDDSNKKSYATIFCLLNYDSNSNKKFDEAELKSLDKVGVMVERNGGKYFKSLDKVANYVNGKSV